MGCGSSTRNIDRVTQQIDRNMLNDNKNDCKIYKLLLLGTGGSGKSTFFKQLRTIHGNGFNDEDRVSFVSYIHYQVITEMKCLINRSKKFSQDYNEQFEDCKISNNTIEAAEYFELLDDDDIITQEIADKIEILWNDDGIKNTFKNRAKFAISDQVNISLIK